MSVIIFTITIITIIVAVYFSMKVYDTPKHHIAFGVTIDDATLESDFLKGVYEKYKVSQKKNYLFLLSLIIPLIILGQLPYFSIVFIYFILYTFITIIIPYKTFIQAHKKMKVYKEENNILKDSKHIVYADLRSAKVNQLSKSYSGIFLVMILLSLVPLMNGFFSDDNSIVIISVSTLFTLIVVFLAYIVFLRRKRTVYSQDAKINEQISIYSKNQWSQFYLGIGISELIFGLLLTFFHYQIVSNILMFMVLMCGLVGVILYIYRRAQKNIYLFIDEVSNEDKNSMKVVDDDVFWKYGLIYNNPKDPSVIVKSRVSFDSTVNIGSKLGKSLWYGSFLLVAVLLVPLMFIMLASDIIEPQVIVNDSLVRIDGIMYDHEFLIEEVDSYEYIDELPRGTKTNGGNTSLYTRGHYSFKGVGESMVFVMNKSDYILHLVLEDGKDIYYSSMKVSNMEKVILALDNNKK